jgi:hypothetical protein
MSKLFSCYRRDKRGKETDRQVYITFFEEESDEVKGKLRMMKKGEVLNLTKRHGECILVRRIQ